MSTSSRTADDTVQDVLTALADPMRRHILLVLARRGVGTATTLATEVPVSRQAVVKHLSVLDRAGLITGQRSGREMQYRVQPEALDITARWMSRLAVEWDLRLQAIKRIAELEP
jgi:DNA-binding transcriptional ArsR family regulator